MPADGDADDRARRDGDDGVVAPSPGADDADATIVSSRPRGSAPVTPASGVLGPTAVAAHEEPDDETVRRRPGPRRPAAVPPEAAGTRQAVAPDAASLRGPRQPRADDAVRVPRGPSPQPPSGGASAAADRVARAVRARAARRAVLAVAVAVVVIVTAVWGLVAILG